MRPLNIKLKIVELQLENIPNFRSYTGTKFYLLMLAVFVETGRATEDDGETEGD